MNAKSSPERGRQNREIARESGFTEIKLIARSDQDIQEIETMKNEQLQRFIMGMPESLQFPQTALQALLQTLMLKGSVAYNTTHGAFSTYLTTLLENGMTALVVPAVKIYSACFPTSLDYVLKSFPGKVSNYLHRYADTGAVMAWTEQNPDWQKETIASVRDGSFDEVLYRMRTATGAMKLDQSMITMLRRMTDELPLAEDVKEQAKAMLERAPDALCQSPRQWNTECNDLRAGILTLLMLDLEHRYGARDDKIKERTCDVPLYAFEREASGLSGTGVVSFMPGTKLAKLYDYALCMGWRYDGWPQYYYQACFGAVSLLNPRIAPIGTLKTSALEAGVAYRYAEEMLDRFLPYTGRSRMDSPVGTGNAYDYAFQAARKLDDDLLRQIRAEFGSFGTINDPVRFASLTAGVLTPGEASLLSSPFDWYAPQ